MKKVFTFIAIVAAAAMALSCQKGNATQEDKSAQGMMLGWWEGTTMDFAFYMTEADEKNNTSFNAWTQGYKGWGDKDKGINDIGNQDFYNIVKEGDKYYRYKYHNQADAEFYYTKEEMKVEGDTFTLVTDYPAEGTQEVIAMASSSEITNSGRVLMDAGVIDPSYAGVKFVYTCTVHFKKASKPSWADTAKAK